MGFENNRFLLSKCSKRFSCSNDSTWITIKLISQLVQIKTRNFAECALKIPKKVQF